MSSESWLILIVAVLWFSCMFLICIVFTHFKNVKNIINKYFTVFIIGFVDQSNVIAIPFAPTQAETLYIRIICEVTLCIAFESLLFTLSGNKKRYNTRIMYMTCYNININV